MGVRLRFSYAVPKKQGKIKSAKGGGGFGSDFHMLCLKYGGPLLSTDNTVIRLRETCHFL